MESSDFCLAFSPQSLLSSRSDTSVDTLFARYNAYPGAAPGLTSFPLALKRLSAKERTDLPSSQGFLINMLGSQTPVDSLSQVICRNNVAFR